MTFKREHATVNKVTVKPCGLTVGCQRTLASIPTLAGSAAERKPVPSCLRKRTTCDERAHRCSTKKRLKSLGYCPPTCQDPHSSLMVVVSEHHPVRRHIYNLCLHCEGTYRKMCVCVGMRDCCTSSGHARRVRVCVRVRLRVAVQVKRDSVVGLESIFTRHWHEKRQEKSCIYIF